jgi:hypothetical protein
MAFANQPLIIAISAEFAELITEEEYNYAEKKED